MSVAIATMGKFIPAVGTGGEARIEYVDTGSSDGWLETKRKPAISVTFRKKKKKKIDVSVSLIGEE